MKNKFTSLLLCFCSICLILAGCQFGSSSSSTETAVSKETQKIEETVFPKDKVVDVKITIDEDEFQDMLDNASAEEYKPAIVEYNGVKLENVGIRTKGNLSLRSVVQMEDSNRYSFKLSFDEYVNQTLEGISKINLNNNYSDATSMREFLTYELAELMGLPTPEYSFVNIYINDELWGFYLAVEQIDESYLERNFGSSYGSLYKGVMTGQGSDLTWLGDDPDLYTGLEVKSEKSDGDALIAMLNELNNGSDYEKYIDIEDALGYIALNVLTNNTDSYLGSNKQNYYLYEEDGVFSILPWDYNMAFGGLGRNSLYIDEPTQGALDERPLIAKLLAVDEYKEQYHQMLSEAIGGYLANDTFTARVQEVKSMIAEYVKADPNAFYTYDEFEKGVTSLISTNASQVKDISEQLDGTSPSSGDGSGSGFDMGGIMGGKGGAGGAAPGGNTGDAAGAPGGAAPDGNAGAPGDAATGGNTGGATADDEAAADGASISKQNENVQTAPDTANNVVQNASENGATTEQSNTANQPPAGEIPSDKTTQNGGQSNTTTATDGAQPDAQVEEGDGMTPPDGFGGGMGEAPDGFGGGMERPEGGMMGGGGFPGAGKDQQSMQQGTTQDLIWVAVSLIIVILACLFVTFYKRKRL
ncbi:CotH kinase family protein [Paenibacillus gallinarum]|uniref:CotH kinase family protein n=1 Tax=Paenibacillus gallinarum TaxID=2762232 RepID=A0ABR8SY41_9BACL|nr:CotH kinase family protein [Paenibacillus gallinarum]MBD7968417.1 CotH kinase family protein [Paenibacillus gallinarum]